MCDCLCFKKKNKVGIVRQMSINSPQKRKNKIAVPIEEKKSISTFQKKDQFRCMFCGGKSCKHEDWTNHINPALDGLHSDLIDNSIYASQRPSTVLIEKFNLISVFKQNQIGLIVNVQREGEHPYCGPNQKLEESGYSYNPQDFIKEGINVLHSGWKDMSVPDSVSYILKLVKEVYHTIHVKKQKVLVHCHAGYGRTGIIIACYLIYNYKTTADVAVKMLRSYRSKCIEKKEQFKFCEMFESYLEKCRTIFTIKKEELQTILKYQREMIVETNENSVQKTIPRVIYEILDKLILQISSLKDSNTNLSSNKIVEKLNGTQELILENEKTILNLKLLLNKGDWEELIANTNIEILLELLFDWIDDCVVCLINPSKLLFISGVIINYVQSRASTSDLNKGLITKILRECKSSLDKNELEILIEFSYLISILKNTVFSHNLDLKKQDDILKAEKEADINNYNILLDRISISCLGLQDTNFNSLSKKISLDQITNDDIIHFFSNLDLKNDQEVEVEQLTFFMNFLIHFISDDMKEKNNELKMLKRSNICLSTLYNRLFPSRKTEDASYVVFKSNKSFKSGIENSIVANKNTKIDVDVDVSHEEEEIVQALLHMHYDLEQFILSGGEEKGFVNYFITKYEDLFKKSNDATPIALKSGKLIAEAAKLNNHKSSKNLIEEYKKVISRHISNKKPISNTRLENKSNKELKEEEHLKSSESQENKFQFKVQLNNSKTPESSERKKRVLFNSTLLNENYNQSHPNMIRENSSISFELNKQIISTEPKFNISSCDSEVDDENSSKAKINIQNNLKISFKKHERAQEIKRKSLNTGDIIKKDLGSNLEYRKKKNNKFISMKNNLITIK